MEAGGFCKLMHWLGLDPGILVKCWVFLTFFLISLPVADLVPFYNTIPVGWIVDTHLQGSFSADPCMLANPLRSHAFN